MKRILALILFSFIIFTACSNEKETILPVDATPKPDKVEESVKVTQEIKTETEKTVKKDPALINNTATTPVKDSTYDSKLVKAQKIGKVMENATPLMRQISNLRESSKKYCVNSEFGFSQKTNGSATSTGRNDDLRGILGDDTIIKNFMIQAEEFYETYKDNDDMYDFTGVCKNNEDIYALIAPKGPGYLIALWKDQKSFEYFEDQPGSHASFGGDGAWSSFIVDEKNGKTYIFDNGKGTTERYWQVRTLDPKTLKTTIIEQCKLTFEFNQETYETNPDKSTLSCEKQYKP